MKIHQAAILLTLSNCIAAVAAQTQKSFLETEWAKFDPGRQVPFVAVCRKLNRPCGMEEAKTNAFAAGPRSKAIMQKHATPRQVLDSITKKHRAYKWAERNGVLNLEPKRPGGKNMLSRQIEELRLEGVSSFRAALDVLSQAEIPFSYQLIGRQPVFAQIDLHLRDVTVREALNEIAKADGQVVWIVSHDQNRRRKGSVSFLMVSWRETGVPFSKEERTGVRFIERR